MGSNPITDQPENTVGAPESRIPCAPSPILELPLLQSAYTLFFFTVMQTGFVVASASARYSQRSQRQVSAPKLVPPSLTRPSINLQSLRQLIRTPPPAPNRVWRVSFFSTLWLARGDRILYCTDNRYFHQRCCDVTVNCGNSDSIPLRRYYLSPTPVSY